MVDYKETATDGDGDGMVQDATPFERPIGTEIVEDEIVEKVEEKPVVEDKPKPVAKEVTCVISKRNYYLPGVGRLIKGKNEINPEHADRWLSLEGVEAC
jgi:hypothetical protein